jgi:pyrimidine operon attenuation protein / uracil phosphoribosyltransferase
MTAKKNIILSKEVAAKKMRRMAYEILENNLEEKEIVLAGIRGSGNVVAHNIEKILKEISTLTIETLTITLDKKMPGEITLSKTMDFTGKVIIVIDDVSNSGKTLLYALKPFIHYHPKKIQTLVLVERSHNSFPVRPDYVGLILATTMQEHIYVEVAGDEVLGARME